MPDFSLVERRHLARCLETRELQPWLRDESLEDSANLPEPYVLAEEIAEDLRSALEQIEDVLGDLRKRAKR
jgi:hypothetical protein